MRACSGSRSVHSCVRLAALLSLVGAAAALGIEIESAGEHCSGTKLHVVPAGNEAQWDQRDRGCNGDPTEPFTVRPARPRGGAAPLSSPTVHRFCMTDFHGRAAASRQFF